MLKIMYPCNYDEFSLSKERVPEYCRKFKSLVIDDYIAEMKMKIKDK